MRHFLNAITLFAILLPLTSVSQAQTIPVAVPVAGIPKEEVEEKEKRIDSSWETRTEARTLTLRVPAPRGQLTDRQGRAFAQNRISYELAIKIPNLPKDDPDAVLNYVRERVRRTNVVLNEDFSISDKEILRHFKNRRWLPLVYGSILTPDKIERIQPHLQAGLELFPSYVRYYPLGKSAAHVLGYVGVEEKVPTGPVASGDPIFGVTKGRDGLEMSFDEYLVGKSGEVNFLFDANGAKLAEEMIKQPVQGYNVVTTLDLEMQLAAENGLSENGRRGAFVVMDVATGDVLTLASWPSYDINEWIPFMSTERFAEISNDPAMPMLARSFRGGYPPASTFKVTVALAALEAGVIDPNSIFPCPQSLLIGDRYFHNWNRKGSEGDMTVVQALMRSCNTWFYRVGMKTGGDAISAMAHLLGMGEKTGLPLNGEIAGYVPNVQALKADHNASLSGGILANAAIGQGHILATPIQVARMMASIANGRHVPRSRLVIQVQDVNNNVIKAFPPEEHAYLEISPRDLDTVRAGMVAVVNSPSGTAKSASNDYVTLAGKTGTGQWKQSKGQYVAWFAGYLPAENPKYAFAIIIEGEPGETVGGGKNAAPIAGKFFNDLYKKLSENGELAGYKKSALTSVAASSGSSTDEGGDEDGPPVADSADDGGTPITETTEPKKKRSLLDRIGFKKRR